MIVTTHDDCDELIVSRFRSGYSFKLTFSWGLNGVLQYYEYISNDHIGDEAYGVAVNEFMSYIKNWTETEIDNSDDAVRRKWIHEPIEVKE